MSKVWKQHFRAVRYELTFKHNVYMSRLKKTTTQYLRIPDGSWILVWMSSIRNGWWLTLPLAYNTAAIVSPVIRGWAGMCIISPLISPLKSGNAAVISK